MDTCKTCKWWKLMTIGTEYRGGVCDVEPVGWYTFEKDAAWGMTHAQGGSDPTPIHTGPDYSCIHHQPKEPKDEK